jgi:hypothetical protein
MAEAAQETWGVELSPSPAVKKWFTWHIQPLECLSSWTVCDFILCHGQPEQFSFAARSCFSLLVFPDLVCAVVNFINTLVNLYPQGKMVNFVKCKYRGKGALFFLFLAVSSLCLVLRIRKTWSFIASDPQIHEGIEPGESSKSLFSYILETTLTAFV